jgi:glycosyltransferase involved in cell wall biosynthesis
MPDISVIICTYNPRRDYFGRVLEALTAQTLPQHRWELLIVDNASTEPLAATWDLSWHPGARHVREESLGLTPARLRGIAEAAGELLIFVDDDNVLAPEFLETAWALRSRYPYLGAYGAGKLEPEFEVEPPAEIRPHLAMLALRNVTGPSWSNNTDDNRSIPWGAGLCVTRTVARLTSQFVDRLDVTSVLDRRGDELFSHGDDIFSWVAASAGYGFGVFPQLHAIHLIDARRVSRTYLLRLMHDATLSERVLQYMLTGTQPRRLTLARCARVLIEGARKGPFAMRCHWASVRGENKAATLVFEKQLHPLDSELPETEALGHSW